MSTQLLSSSHAWMDHDTIKCCCRLQHCLPLVCSWLYRASQHCAVQLPAIAQLAVIVDFELKQMSRFGSNKPAAANDYAAASHRMLLHGTCRCVWHLHMQRHWPRLSHCRPQSEGHMQPSHTERLCRTAAACSSLQQQIHGKQCQQSGPARLALLG